MRTSRASLTKLPHFILFLALGLGISAPAAAGPAESEKARRERWAQLSPVEKDKIVRNYKRWQGLPPERKKLILERHKVLEASQARRELARKEINTLADRSLAAQKPQKKTPR